MVESELVSAQFAWLARILWDSSLRLSFEVGVQAADGSFLRFAV